MKPFLQIRAWLLLFLSGFLAVMIVLSCTQQEGKETTSSSSSSSTGPSSTTGDTEEKEEDLLTCELPSSCSGNKCCSKDEDCEELCTDSKKLDLSGIAKDKCFDLEEETVERLVKIFTKILKKPNEDDLENELKDEDIELICATVKDLDKNLLEDVIKEYSHRQAQRFLTWLAETEEALEIFTNAEDDDGIDMLKRLLAEAVGESSTSHANILKGLQKLINTDEDDNDDQKPLMSLANKNGNERLVRYFHEWFIEDEDEGICGKTSNQPVADSNQYSGDHANIADKNNKEEACILAVYCTIDDTLPKEDQSDFRENMANIVNYRIGFIKDDKDNGGLNPDPADVGKDVAPFALDDDDVEEWSDNACANLKYYWNNGTTGLTLGLNE